MSMPALLNRLDARPCGAGRPRRLRKPRLSIYVLVYLNPCTARHLD